MTTFLPRRLLQLVLVAAATLAVGSLSAQPQEPRAARSFKSEPIPGQYIVVFKDEVDDADAESDVAVRRSGGRRHHVFSRALKGFSATLSDAGVQNLRNDRRVAYIEQDQTVSIDQSQSPATWGLDRIDQADRPLDTLYHYSQTGQGVHAFIIDTGIRADHNEFAGRILPGFTSVLDGRGTNDCNGHGTHVSGTVGGTTWGVAKQVSIIPVRVLDCKGSGSWSGVIAGIDWVANHALRPAVANMSLGGAKSTAINAAVASAVAKGVVMVVAAGNETTNACNKSPASEPSAVTVGSIGKTDTMSSFSNYGTCVDLFAPGEGITSAWYTSASATNAISGTSMASPHVAGVVALALQASPTSSPAAISQYIEDTATAGRLKSINTGSPNLLLYALGSGGGTPPPEPTVPTIAVKTLSGTAVTERRKTSWTAKVTVTLRNLEGTSAVSNATVSGSFSTGGTGSCVTGSTSSCSISSATLSGSTTSTVFTVTGVVATGKTYDSSQNSNSQVTISTR